MADNKLRQPKMKNDYKIESLKDFLYLDTERVRSFAAQFYNGLPEARTLFGDKNNTVDASLGIKAMLGVGTKVFAEKSTTETQSLHLALFNMFESKAKEQGFVNIEDLSGPLLEARCQVRLVDYLDAARKIRLMSEIAPLINKIQGNEGLTKSQKGLQRKESEQKRYFNNIASTIEGVFGEELYGVGYMEGKPRLSMHLQREYMQLRNTGLIGTSQEILSEQWTVLGMVIERESKAANTVNEGSFAEAINAMGITLDTIKKQLIPILSNTDNTVDLIPIAIYREFLPGKNTNA
jgi:hypothetical protein